MEYMPLGNLEQRVGASGCSEKETATITYQILRALKSMHEKGFVHRNLKPRVSLQ
jgi:serine/threonine protein kinase